MIIPINQDLIQDVKILTIEGEPWVAYKISKDDNIMLKNYFNKKEVRT